ncbi:MAG: hypothetical protein H8D22_06590 [Candidatus Cloacimonetes bacterium]|nr:hypothetical protein [Candidatus Cloacimonadota bacterium]MBL7083874.1 hypothetical protein [Candidatus Aminicenantes bacterium]
MKKARPDIRLKNIFKYFDQVKFEEKIPQPKKILESFNYEEIYKKTPWWTHLKFTSYLKNWYQVVHEYNKSFKFYRWARNVEISANQHFKEDYEYYAFYYGQPLIESSVISLSSTWDKMLLFIISTIVIFYKEHHDEIAKLLIFNKNAIENGSYKKYIISKWKTKSKINSIKKMDFTNCTKDFNAIVKKINSFRSLQEYRNTIIHGFKPPLEVKWPKAELSFNSLAFGEYVPKKYCKILSVTKRALINMCEILNDGQNLILKIIQNSYR